jgi:uncharacterized protein (UPF0264 family)
MGELLELQRDFRAMAIQPIPDGVIAFKIGLAGCATHPHWQTTWQDAVDRLADNNQPTSPRPVGVVYADWRAAAAPNPSEVLNAAVKLMCAAILVDTWDKSSGALFEHWPAEDLCKFIEASQRLGMRLVLAGSLSDADAPIAAGLAPDLVAVRTAACEGGRNGSVSSSRVRHLKALLRTTALPSNGTSRGRCQDMNSIAR